MATTVATKVIRIDIINAAQNAQQARAAAAQLASIDTAANSTAKTLKGFASIGGILKTSLGVLGGIGIVTTFTEAAVAAIKAADAYGVLTARFNTLTGSVSGGREALNEAMKISISTGAAIDGVAKLYEKAYRAGQQYGLGTREISLITEGFSNSLRLSGASTQEAQASLIQFGQALASGKLQGDEFRSLAENNSYFITKFAEALGVTTGQLKKMGTEGKLTTELFFKTMLTVGSDGVTLLERINAEAQGIPLSMKAALEAVETAAGGAIGEFINVLFPKQQGKNIFQQVAESINALRIQFQGLAREFDAGNKSVWERIGLIYGRGLKVAFGLAEPEEMPGASPIDAQQKNIRDTLAAIKNENEKRAGLALDTSLSPKEIMEQNEAIDKELIKQRALLQKYTGLQKEFVAEANKTNEVKPIEFKAGNNDDDKKKKGATGDSPLTNYLQKTKAELELTRKEYEQVLAGVEITKVKEATLLEKFNAEVDSGKIEVRKGESALLDRVRAQVTELSRLKDLMEAYERSAKAAQEAAEKAVAAASGGGETDIINKLTSGYNVNRNRLLDEEAAIRGRLERGVGDTGEQQFLANRLNQIMEELDPNIAFTRSQLKELEADTKSVSEVLNDNLGKAVQDLGDKFVDFALGAEVSFSDLVTGIIKDIARLIVSNEMTKLLQPITSSNNVLGALIELGVGFFTGGPAPTSGEFARMDRGQINTKAKGGVITPWGEVDLARYAAGGIAYRPQLNLIGEGTMPEAYVPLPDGRSIPVSMQGGGGGGMQVNIYNMNDENEVSTETKTDSNGDQQLEVFIRKRVREVVTGDINAGTGVGKAMESKYGLRRV